MTRLAFATQSAGDSQFSLERLVNYYPRPWPQRATGEVMLKGCAGLREWVTGLGGPVKALHEANNKIYAIAGQNAWEIDSGGTATALGLIGDQDASIADIGDHVAFCAGGNYRVWDGSSFTAPSIGTLDSVRAVAAMDGRIIACGVKDGRRDRVVCSDYGDATTFGGTAFATAESDPDTMIGLEQNGSQLFFIGFRTIEVWYASGSGSFPFLRTPGGVVNIGGAATGGHVVDERTGTLFFIGINRQVFVMNGFTPQKISTPAVDGALGGAEPTLFLYDQEGDRFLCARTLSGTTWAYHIESGTWVERASVNIDSPWRARSSAFYALTREWVAGGDGVLYKVDDDHYADGPDPLIGYAVSLPVVRQGLPFTVNRLDVDFASGDAPLGQDATATMYLKRNAREFHPGRSRSIGLTGEYDRRVWWNGLGRHRRFQCALEITDPVPRDIIGANLS